MPLVCRDLCKGFDSPHGRTQALEGVSFRIEDGQFLCLVGPSGCGKTTLLRILAGLSPADAGEVTLDGTPPGQSHRTALVFQDHGLFPWMTILDNVAFALETRGVPRAERRARAEDLVRRVGLGSFLRHYPPQLSVGMRQRVGIARAFLSDPRLLLMDEPLGSLDYQTRRILQDELLRLWEENPKEILFVTHDIHEAVLLADRVLVMSGRPGRILANLPVPVPRPRRDGVEINRELTLLKRRIWGMLEEQVRRDLGVVG
jgi:NitT/TauT family transport system ATP-binding protein